MQMLVYTGTCEHVNIVLGKCSTSDMAVASGPAGPVLAGPVFKVIFGTAHVQIMNNENTFGAALTTLLSTRAYTPHPLAAHCHS